VETVKSPAEQRVLLRNVSWETYERLLADQQSSSAPRLTYDRGLLEIVSPSTEHEEVNRLLAALVETVAEETGTEFRNVGSMTFKRENLRRGFEPDTCFYIQNEGSVRGKAQIDLADDPPPDLVIEVDVASPSLDKLPIYAQVGVPEIWRVSGGRTAILRLRSDGTGYSEVRESEALPAVTGRDLTRFVEGGRTLGRLSWNREVREWARGLRA